MHGGDVWQAGEALGIAAAELLDFSANINPRGLPARAAARLARDACDARLLGAYPDREARCLREALSRKLGVATESIVVGPGAEALLAPILRATAAASVLVPVPAFSEYRRVCEQQAAAFLLFGIGRAECFRLPVQRFCARIAAERAAMALVNNPHNPSGALLEAREVARIAEAAADCGAALLVDEAFIDYVPGASFAASAADCRGCIVLRSLTKFYGCPALRVGYAVAHPETAARIRDLLPTWPVSQLALDALAEAVADEEFAAQSLEENAAARAQLSAELSSLGCTVFPPAANFLLVELAEGMPPAADLRTRLIARHRILLRNCDSYENLAPGRYVRVAVRSPEENARLVEALAAELRSS